MSARSAGLGFEEIETRAVRGENLRGMGRGSWFEEIDPRWRGVPSLEVNKVDEHLKELTRPGLRT
jgi:hypothetical protein